MGDMPAKIWALPGITRGYWSPAPSKHPNSAKIAYIRADLVEPLVEALRCLPVEWLKSGVAADSRSDGLRIEMRIVGTTYEAEITVGDLRSARAALQAYEAAQ